MFKKISTFLFLILSIFLFGCNETETSIENGESLIKLSSNNFEYNQHIPQKFTCDGENISPHFTWSGFPKETKSFALSIIDPDATSGEFIHWLITNIPAENTILEENLDSFETFQMIQNDAGKIGYVGPCPLSGTHRYFFTLYALDVETLEGLTKSNFVEEVEKHTLAKGELVGLYEKKSEE